MITRYRLESCGNYFDWVVSWAGTVNKGPKNKIRTRLKKLSDIRAVWFFLTVRQYIQVMVVIDCIKYQWLLIPIEFIPIEFKVEIQLNMKINAIMFITHCFNRLYSMISNWKWLIYIWLVSVLFSPVILIREIATKSVHYNNRIHKYSIQAQHKGASWHWTIKTGLCQKIFFLFSQF